MKVHAREQQGWVAAQGKVSQGRMVGDKACRHAGTVASVLRVTIQQQPNKSKAGPVTMICQNSSENQASLGMCCQMEIGAQGEAQEWVHQACTVSQNRALAGSGILNQLPPPALPQPCSPTLEWSNSGLRQGQPHSSLHRDPVCLQNLNRSGFGALVSNCVLTGHVLLSDLRTGST